MSGLSCDDLYAPCAPQFGDQPSIFVFPVLPEQFFPDLVLQFIIEGTDASIFPFYHFHQVTTGGGGDHFADLAGT